MKIPSPLPALTVLVLVGAHVAHVAADEATPIYDNDGVETLPSPEALQLLSLTYETLAADYYWLRSLSHFGDIAMHRVGYPSLPPLVRRVLKLDPYFETAYVFAGTALTVQQLDPRHSVEIMEPGLKYRPNNWRIPFLLGFNHYYFIGNHKRAAEVLALAARLPEAPDYVGPLATRVAADAGTPEVGLELIDAVLDGISDPTLRETYLERKKLLLVDLHLKWLTEAVNRFAEQLGHRPTALAELIDHGIMRALPEEPFGGQYILSQAGEVATTSKVELLRLPDNAKGAK